MASSIAQFDPEYEARLRKVCPPQYWNTVHVCASGYAGYLDQKTGHIVPLGCHLCVAREIEQDSMGDPMVGGKKLLRAEEMPDGESLARSIAPIVRANVFFCPSCRLLLTTLLPNFDQRINL